MSADLLRLAASTLEVHIKAAVEFGYEGTREDAANGWLGGPVGEFCALMSPAVVAALAVLLDDMADRVESHLYLQGDPDLCPCSEVDGWHQLANVARAILREAPDA